MLCFPSLRLGGGSRNCAASVSDFVDLHYRNLVRFRRPTLAAHCWRGNTEGELEVGPSMIDGCPFRTGGLVERKKE
ncbi:unnamed protein product [Calypogeia fissa]